MLVHLNGQLVEHTRATVSIFDRGFLFGDGVYEGLRSTSNAQGEPVVIGLAHHAQRMRASLAEARITGFDTAALAPLTDELLRANNLVEAFIYWQVTRGTPPGDQGLARARVTKQNMAPTVVGFATAVPAVRDCKVPETRRVALRPDTRWSRGHLKSISLLGGVLAAFEADEQGDEDAIMVRDGLITEGTATNVFLYADNHYITPSLESAPMLAGVTRRLLLDECPGIEERPVTPAELFAAEEVMLVGTKTMVASVVAFDGRPVGAAPMRNLAPGPQSQRLLNLLVSAIERDVRSPAQPSSPRPQARTLKHQATP